MRYQRCGGACRDFYMPGYCAAIACPHCSYVAIRCKKCGGVKGAQRSLWSHARWYVTRGGKYGYRAIH